LLVAAFAQDRPELLAAATRDRLHQPFRSQACPLLPALLPLAETPQFYAVTLSGAGPSVLLIADPKAPEAALLAAIRNCCDNLPVEIVQTTLHHP
jgi:homoserine kinase